MPQKLRKALHQAAVSLASSVKYRGAGTAEFLYDVDRGEIYFIEVNARIQVEHPVSEMVTGADLVGWQLRIAGGERLDLAQSDIKVAGHSIECRINAEDWAAGFVPRPGTIRRWSPPVGEGIRLDTHMSEGASIPPFYDSMVAKLIVTGTDRSDAIARLEASLGAFEVEGVPTTIGLHQAIVAHPDFRENRIHTRWLEQVLLPELGQ
jgi:acetyl-CoA carboxylase biotin carboxylase subunit